ncbi:MAG: type II secretion system F family protein [Halalkalicoccus sp.]
MTGIATAGAFVVLAGWWLLVLLACRSPRRTTRTVGTFAGGLYDRYREKRERRLDAAHVPVGYRRYAAFSLLYAIGGALSGAVLWGLFASLALSAAGFSGTPATVTTLLVAGWLGIVSGIAVYWLRWWWPGHVADARARRIDAAMPRTVAFLYALSRSGMPVPEVLRTLADNEGVYGEPAREFALAVREMDRAGADLLTALESTARRTPSAELEEFVQNVTSVLRSGQSLPEFLETQYERYQDDAEAKQGRLLTQLATLAEIYVTALVAGPLFLLTILVVIGLTIEETLPALSALVYVVVPLSNLLFVVYLSTLTEPIRPGGVDGDDGSAVGGVLNVRRRTRVLPDGGSIRRENEERLAFYERYRAVLERLADPLESVRTRPERLLYLTVPVGLLAVTLRLRSGGLEVRVVDDALVQSALFVLGTYAAVATLRERRVSRIERALPDVLARLASINEAGVSIADSVGRVRRGDLGALSAEFDRIWRDVEWGADLESALWRFERRVRSASVTRTVALVTNAARASGRLGPVLRIAAAQGRAERRLERDREDELLTYLVVIYLSFLVFVLIIVVLNDVLIPSLPEPTEGLETGAGSATNFGGGDTEAYSLVFGHALLIQGVLSGYLAGRMSGSSVRAGARHATVLLGAAYAVVLVI